MSAGLGGRRSSSPYVEATRSASPLGLGRGPSAVGLQDSPASGRRGSNASGRGSPSASPPKGITAATSSPLGSPYGGRRSSGAGVAAAGSPRGSGGSASNLQLPSEPRGPRGSYQQTISDKRFSMLPTVDVGMPLFSMQRRSRVSADTGLAGGNDDNEEDDDGGRGGPAPRRGSKVSALQKILQVNAGGNSAQSKGRTPVANFKADKERTIKRDPTAPQPQQPPLRPVLGRGLDLPPSSERMPGQGPPMSLYSICEVVEWRAQHGGKHTAYGTITNKGKADESITYKKLHAQVLKVATGLQAKIPVGGAHAQAPRVALVFPTDNNDSLLNFVAAFFGCLHAGVIPVMAEFPYPNADFSRPGFLLGAVSASFALTDDHGKKMLYDKKKGNITSPPGWPPLTWLNVASFSKSKTIPAHHPSSPDDIAYIQYSLHSDGGIRGVTVSHGRLGGFFCGGGGSQTAGC